MSTEKSKMKTEAVYIVVQAAISILVGQAKDVGER